MLLTREVLQGIFSGLVNAESDYLADQIVPATPGPQYGVIGTRDFLAQLDDIGDLDVAACSEALELPEATAGSVNYNTIAYAAKRVLCLDVEAQNQVAVSEAEQLLSEIRQAILYKKEKRLEALIRTGTWNAVSGAVAAGDQWDTSTGDPIEQLLLDNEAIPGGANVVVMGKAAWRSFRTNVNVRSYLSDNSFRLLNAQGGSDMISGMFGRDVRLYVPSAMDAAAGTFIWDDDYFVARIAGQGSRGRMGPLLNPTAIARIESLPMTVSTEMKIDAGARGGQLMRVAHEEAVVQVTADLGVLHTAVNG